MLIAKLFGWIIEHKEDITRIEKRLRNMTPEQREADAEDLYRRAMQRLLEDRSATDEGEPEGGHTFEDDGRIASDARPRLRGVESIRRSFTGVLVLPVSI